jgi:neurofibromin 1
MLKDPGTASAICSNVGPFKDSIILCLSNILSANVDVGLKYSLSMGYHPDIQTRSAFMQVLTNILKQGTEFETLAESATEDRYNKLVGVSTPPNGNNILKPFHTLYLLL